MDFMEGGNLWDALTLLDKWGDPIYQWKGRGKRVAHDIALGMHFLHDLRSPHGAYVIVAAGQVVL